MQKLKIVAELKTQQVATEFSSKTRGDNFNFEFASQTRPFIVISRFAAE